MHRFLLIAASVVVLASNGGVAAAQSELPESSRACRLYEAAFRAVEPQAARFAGGGEQRRFSYRVFDAPHDKAVARRRSAAGIDLRACPDLEQLVLASGRQIVGTRPVLGVRLIGPAFEHFSRPVRHEGKTYLTYYLNGRDEGVDIVLRQEAGGSWVVETADAWETIVLN